MRLYKQTFEKNAAEFIEAVQISPEILVIWVQSWITVSSSLRYCFGWDCCLIKLLFFSSGWQWRGMQNSRHRHEQSSWHDRIQWKAELKRTTMEHIKRLDTMSRTQKFITWQPSCQNNNPDYWSWCRGPGWLLLAAGWQRGSELSLRSLISGCSGGCG